MRIHVKAGKDANVRIWLPTALALNSFTALFIPGALEQQGIHVTYTQALRFIRTIRECKRRNPDWVLVEAKSGDAEVFVKL